MVTAALALVLAPMYGSFGLFDPWETHYAEVARNMRVSGDWISPWWGSEWPAGQVCQKLQDCEAGWVCQASRAEYLDRRPRCRPEGVPVEGRYFFSKPALPFWMMALGMGALGVGPWGVRLLFLGVALFGVFELARAATRLWGTRGGMLAGLALGAAPMYALMSRQALTDGPFVALLAAACGRFMTGLWAGNSDERASQGVVGGLLAALGVVVVPQALLVGVRLGMSVHVGGLRIPAGPLHAMVWLTMGGMFARSVLGTRPTRGQVDLWAGYLLLGLAVLSKGVLGLALPGASVLLFMVIARDRLLLRRLELGGGLIVAAVVALPWYAAMFARHHPAFWERFFLHDHFRRLTQGVHAVEGGGFEHYVLWLGLAMFPWSAFLPAALARELRRGPRELKGPDLARLFCGVWLLTCLAVFTLARTKYHHYILPAAPPAAILVALLIDDLASGRLGRRAAALTLATAGGAIVVLATDLSSDPQRIINLITYLYDREWPSGMDLGGELAILGALAGAAAVGPALLRRPGWTPAALGVVSLAIAGWCVSRYMPAISGTWSQAALVDAYHADCTPAVPPERLSSGRLRCEAPLIAYKMYWRGETWHSRNTVLPLRKPEQIRHFFGSEESKLPFYALAERRRVEHGLTLEIPEERRPLIRTVHDGNAKFVLLHVPAAAPLPPKP